MNKFFNFLGLIRKSGNLVMGYNKCEEIRNKRNVYLFIISNDASESTRKKFKNHCISKNISLIEDFTKEELGYPIGRDEMKILAITDKSMAEKVKSLYEEGKKY